MQEAVPLPFAAGSAMASSSELLEVVSKAVMTRKAQTMKFTWFFGSAGRCCAASVAMQRDVEANNPNFQAS